MREILFRAKGLYKDRWYYGYYVEHKKSMQNYIIDLDEEVMDTQHLIAKSTLSQYTGLKDKNGTKIFEGDIVEFETNVNCIKNELKPYWKDCYEKKYALGGGTWWVRKDQAIVQWNSKDGMWDLKVYNNGRYKRKSKLFTYRESDYVVIGNIYDNPELLED